MKTWQIFALVLLVGLLLLALTKYLVIYGIIKKAIEATQAEINETEAQVGSTRLSQEEITKLLARRDLLRANLAQLTATYNQYK